MHFRTLHSQTRSHVFSLCAPTPKSHHTTFSAQNIHQDGDRHRLNISYVNSALLGDESELKPPLCCPSLVMV